MTNTEHLKSEIEKTAEQMGLAVTTIGKLVGQGGHFYSRLCDGKRVWPETAAAVLVKLAELRSPDHPPQNTEDAA